MTDPARPFSPQLAVVFGGSGFLGRNVVRALARRGYRVRVAVRRPNLAPEVMTAGKVGQVQAVQANLRFPHSVEAVVDGADVVVNLVGILRPSGRQTFSAVQAEGAGVVARAAREGGARLVHVSALGADPDSDSAYARSKAEGEAAVFEARPEASVLRPSVIFGPDDGFFNRFASLARLLPVLPLAGAETRFQPVYVGDVAEAVARAAEGAGPGGRVYELGGPQVRTLRELVAYVLEATHRRRLVVSMPFGAARLQARVTEILDTLTLGLLPDAFLLTRDQVALLEEGDNVVSAAARAEGRTLEGLGITPTAYEAVAPSYLVRFLPAGQFEARRQALLNSPSPDTLAPVSAGPASQFQPRVAPGPAALDQGPSR